MTRKPVVSDSLSRWQDSLLGEADVSLESLARHYLGKSVAETGRNGIISGLSSLCAQESVGRSAAAMMDRMDNLVSGLLVISGGMELNELHLALEGEISFHDLEYRLANLTERLIVYLGRDGLYSLNPLLQPYLAPRAVSADILFGPEPAQEGDSGLPGAGVSGSLETGRGMAQSIQDLGLVAYALLSEESDPTLKDGTLSARARKRVSELSGGDASAAEIVQNILGTLVKNGIGARRERGIAVDMKAFADILSAGAGALPYILVMAALTGRFDAQYRLLEAGFDPFLSREFVFSERGLMRLCFFLAREMAVPGSADALYSAIAAFGLVERRNGELVCVGARTAGRKESAEAEGARSVTMDGSGVIHVLPGARLCDILTLLDMGTLVSAAGAWRLSVTRNSARRMFASGKTTEEIEATLSSLCGRTIPQALRYDIESWKSQFDAVRIYKGHFLVVDEKSGDVIDRSGVLRELPHERLRDGMYYFPTLHPGVLEATLTSLGLPAPHPTNSIREARGQREKGNEEPSAAKASGHVKKSYRDTAVEAAPACAKVDFSGLRFGTSGESAEADAALASALANEIAQLGVDSRKRLALTELVSRKLVYTATQLHAMVGAREAAEARPSRRGMLSRHDHDCASGLDFVGKLRIIQSAMKARYSRLDVRWAANGIPRSALVRPSGVKKTDKDYEMEGEDLATGSPVTIRVGSITSVCLRRGFYLGDE